MIGEQERLALITGGSAGIGAEFARQLHARGLSVVLVARREDRLRTLCMELNTLRPESAHYVVADLTTAGGLGRVEAFIQEHPIEVLVNNAGRGSFGAFDQLPLEQELNLVALNIIAPLRLSHAVLPSMKEQKKGAIINVASLAAFRGLPFMATYAATKAFNFIHSLGLRYEVGTCGVKVIAICPGPTATDFQGVARIPGSLTGMKRDTVQSVVQSSMKALDADRAWLVPCMRAKIIALTLKVLPHAVCSRISAGILKSSLRSS